MKKENCGSERRSSCAVSMALDVFGDKWSLLILRDLMFTDKRSYGELLCSKEGIATNILASRLVMLEERGLVRKTPDPAHTRRSRYFLTEKGIDLLPVMLELMAWSHRHEPGAEACGAHMERFRTARPALIAEHRKRLLEAHAAE